jgi:hypothetical protein
LNFILIRLEGRNCYTTEKLTLKLREKLFILYFQKSFLFITDWWKEILIGREHFGKKSLFFFLRLLPRIEIFMILTISYLNWLATAQQ